MKNLIEGVVLVQGKGQDASLPKAIPIRAALASFAKTIGFDNYSVAIQSEEEGTQTDPAIVLSNLNLIDTSHAEWNQIMEIRKDGDSKKKLKRLRLFVHENFEGKSIAYIEDDLCRRLDQYEQASSKFGFQKITSSLSMILDAKSLHAAAGAGLAGALFGGPIVGGVAAASVEIGKIAINIAEKHHEMKAWQDGHDLAYIFNVQRTLNK